MVSQRARHHAPYRLPTSASVKVNLGLIRTLLTKRFGRHGNLNGS